MIPTTGIQRLMPTDPSMQSVFDLCREHGWPLVWVAGDDGPGASVPVTLGFAARPTTTIEVVLGEWVSIAHVAVVGSEAQEVAAELASELSLESPALWLQRYDTVTAVPDRAEALMYAVIQAPPAIDHQLVDRVRAALADPDAMVRRAALFAVEWRPWPPFYDVVERMVDQDPELDVSEAALGLLQEWPAAWKPEASP